MPHNHPPRCCCENLIAKGPDVRDPAGVCPSCVEHGELAQPECGSCHTPWGRPHTDYCQLTAPAEYPGQPDRCTFPNTTVSPDLLGEAQPNAYDVIQHERAEASRRVAGYCEACGSTGGQHMAACPERLVTYPGGEVRPANDPPDPHTCDGRNCGGRPHA